MGQCVSRKGAHALAQSSTSKSPPTLRRATSTRSTTTAMHHKRNSNSRHNNNNIKMAVYSSLRIPSSETDESKGATKRQSGPVTKGMAMSFGFRRRPVSASQIILQDNSKSLDTTDTNGNNDRDSMMIDNNITVTDNISNTQQRLPSQTAKNPLQGNGGGGGGGGGGMRSGNRFGFRTSSSGGKPLTNKVGDSHIVSHTNIESRNNNMEKVRIKSPTSACTPPNNKIVQQKSFILSDQNKNKAQSPTSGAVPISKYKLQCSNLPKPQLPVRLSDKNAKQVANHSKKQGQITATTAIDDNGSSKEGSVTEDSGVSSHTSDQTDLDSVHSIHMLDYSPTYRKYRRQRQLEMVVKGKHFDVRDLTDDGTVIESSLIPLPKLPSVFQNEPAVQSRQPQVTEYPVDEDDTDACIRPNLNTFARNTTCMERSLENQRYRQSTDHMSLSTTSEESTEEKVRRDRAYNEKSIRSTQQPMHESAHSATSTISQDASPSSSDDCGGEAMIDSYNFSLSSGDEKEPSPIINKKANLTLNTPTSLPLNKTFDGESPSATSAHEVLLTIEDPKFAAVAASVTGHLLEDETSPVDSLISSCTDSEEITQAKQHKEKSNKMTESNTSKDINEKSLQSPGTPTNASLSLSDGRDFFDDEIADQPSLLVFDTDIAVSENTMVEEAPSSIKSVKPSLADSSPVPTRKTAAGTSKLSQMQRANSLDTLSPCDSIASDDLMLDFEQSLSSGFDDSTDRLDSKHGSTYSSMDIQETKDFHRDVRQEWSALLNKRNRKEGSPSLSTSGRSGGSRLQTFQRNRADSQQLSCAPDSPRSLDGIGNTNSNSGGQITGAAIGGGSRSRVPSTSSASHSPLRLSRRYMATTSPTAQLTSYDSDDSIRLDRSTHGSMVQDIVSIKTMLLKLKRVLQEPDEDLLMRSETLNPFESPLKNGHFNNNDTLSSQTSLDNGLSSTDDRFELADLRRQVLFLQAQLEDRERTVQQLRQQVVEVTTASNSAPTSICESTTEMCNAATQTDRIRPMSAGPSLLHSFPTDSSKSGGPLVSMNNEQSISVLALKKREHQKRVVTSLSEFRPSNQNSNHNMDTTSTTTTPTPTTTSNNHFNTNHNLLRVFNKKSTDTSSCVPNHNHRQTSRPISPANPSAIPTRRSHSHSRIRITNTQYL